MQKKGQLGVLELIAIAVGGMVGGGIFTILGVSVAMVGAYTPVAILVGGAIAALAAYSYIKLGVYYQDEGSTYTFSKLTFPSKPFVSSLIGWCVVFGYISTTALYAYTFSSYALSNTHWAQSEMARKAVAGAVIGAFALVNVWSVKGMGEIEDLMVYSKLAILALISAVLIAHGKTSLPTLMAHETDVSVWSILIIASLTFVAYEGFELVINAVKEMDNPTHAIPRSIYWAILITIGVYVVIAVGAILSIPFADLVRNKESALASGAESILGNWGNRLVVLGALLATCSAISGTVFGASRQMAVIAQDGYMPDWLARRRSQIPVNAIVCLSFCAFGLVLAGSLEIILQFGSITFLLVSLLMALTNFKIRKKTQSSALVTGVAVLALTAGTCLIIHYEWMHEPSQLGFTLLLYGGLTALAWGFSRQHAKALKRSSHASNQ